VAAGQAGQVVEHEIAQAELFLPRAQHGDERRVVCEGAERLEHANRNGTSRNGRQGSCFARLVDHVGHEGGTRADHKQSVCFVHGWRIGLEQSMPDTLFIAGVPIDRQEPLLRPAVYRSGLLKLGKGFRKIRALLATGRGESSKQKAAVHTHADRLSP
jgi:hypothetical protein